MHNVGRVLQPSEIDHLLHSRMAPLNHLYRSIEWFYGMTHTVPHQFSEFIDQLRHPDGEYRIRLLGSWMIISLRHGMQYVWAVDPECWVDISEMPVHRFTQGEPRWPRPKGQDGVFAWRQQQGPVVYEGRRSLKIGHGHDVTVQWDRWMSLVQALPTPPEWGSLEHVAWLSTHLPAYHPEDRTLHLLEYPPIRVPRTVSSVSVRPLGGNSGWYPLVSVDFQFPVRLAGEH